MSRRSAGLFDLLEDEKKAERKAQQREEIAKRYRAGYCPDQDKAVQRAADLLGLSTTHISPRGNKDHEKWACEIAVGGSVVSVKGRKPTSVKAGGGIRGEVKGFSKNARRRLIRKVGSIDRDAIKQMPIFITLTYPGIWPNDPKVWKKHLDTWSKRLKRRYPKACAIWKLEPQKRGAPHYHLIVLNVPHISKNWLAESWYEVVGSGDDKHLRAGTRVETIRTWRGCMSYAAKYTAKVIEELPEGWEKVGRMWGIIGREHLPITIIRFAVHKALFLKIRDFLWRCIGGPPPGWIQYDDDGLTAMIDWGQLSSFA
ncbi:MAG TPA: hypothetical protein DCM28_21965 [Phycisphaerales bacterium]|nr:hypothetical protein [Phycisphaerales bacterium]